MIFLGITLKRVYYGVVYELKQLINDFGCIFYGFIVQAYAIIVEVLVQRINREDIGC